MLFLAAARAGMPGAPSPLEDIRQTLSTRQNVTFGEFDTSHFIRREAFDRYLEAVNDFFGGAPV